jgi:transposase
MKPISEDLRTRIVTVYEETEVSYPTVAARVQVSESSVRRFGQQWRDRGTVRPHPHGGGPPSKLEETGMSLVTTLANTQGDARQDELGALGTKQTGMDVSQPTICRILQRADVTRKKTRRATEREEDAVNAARQTFAEQQKRLQVDDIIAVDEMGSVTGMSRT